MFTSLKTDAHDAGPDIVTWQCRRTSSNIVIDGRLNEEAWRDATEITCLYEIRSPLRGGPLQVNDKINIRILHDDKNLYIGAIIRDRDIVANPESAKYVGRQTLFLDGDTFEVFIQPDSGEPVYYEFHVNPLNAQWTLRYPASQGYMKWATTSPSVQSATKIAGTLNRLDEDRHWTVEMAIPLSEITGTDGKPVNIVDGSKWRVAFCLYDYQYYHGDYDGGGTLKFFSTSRFPQLNFHDRKYYNLMTFRNP